MERTRFLEALDGHRAVAILRAGDPDVAREAMAAAVRGGFRLVEVTMTTPGALDLIAELAADERLVVGAGTVLERSEAEEAVAAGARFLVSPVVDPAVIALAGELGAAAVPGAFTPTEILLAHRAGAAAVKLFPASGRGPGWLRSVLRPMPFLPVVPTDGVEPSNARAWLDAGARAVGFVGSLFDPDELARHDWAAVEERARSAAASVAER